MNENIQDCLKNLQKREYKNMLGDTNIPLYKNKDFGAIEKFHLLLGPACNMKCRHCAQTKDKIITNEDKFFFKLNPKVWELIKNYIAYCLNNPPVIYCKTRKFIFWGGEPLLHWEIIKDIVSRAKNEFGITKNKNFHFSIISNGLLLNAEIINFINENDISFCFSYDAPHPFAIRDYVSDEICEKVKQIKGYNIHASCNAINNDPLLAYYCLLNKFPDATEIDVNPKLIQAPGIPQYIYNWDWDVIRNNLKKLRIAAQMDNKFALNLIYRYYLVSGQPNEKGINIACSIGIGLLNCTLNGYILACYDSFDKIGTIDNSLQKLHDNSCERLKLLQSPECKACRHLDICGANICKVNAQDENNRYYACSNYWFKFYDLLKMELVNLRKPLSAEDRIWYEEQEKIINKQAEEFIKERKKNGKGYTIISKE